MKLLKCVLCGGELDIISNKDDFGKKVRCIKCGFTNASETKPPPEVFVIRRKIKD